MLQKIRGKKDQLLSRPKVQRGIIVAGMLALAFASLAPSNAGNG
jgi:hypothetical protein